jgi:hypothetical protein
MLADEADHAGMQGGRWRQGRVAHPEQADFKGQLRQAGQVRGHRLQNLSGAAGIPGEDEIEIVTRCPAAHGSGRSGQLARGSISQPKRE